MEKTSLPELDVFTTPKLDKAIAEKIQKNYKKSIENRDKELLKVQRHIINVGGPLTALHDLLESQQELSHDQLLNLVEWALCLLGNATNSISVLRRSKILYAINPTKISLAEAPFPNAGKQLFGYDITKIAADGADIVCNLQKNLNQQHPQSSSWSKPPLKKYQAKKTKNFVRLRSSQIVTLIRQRANFNSSNSPFEASKTTAPINGASSLLYKELAKYNAGFCYFKNCSRFSNSEKASSPVVTKLQVSKRGNRNVVTKGCHKACPFQRPSVLPQNVFSCKKSWWSTPCFGSKSSQQVYPNGTFQDGESHDNKVPHKQGGLHDKYRSYGRLFHRPSTPKLTTIPSLPMVRTVLPICNNAIWPKRGTTSIHKINEARNSLATRSGCSNDYFSRRHTCSRSNNPYIKPTRTYDHKSTRVIRISDPLQKVSSCSNTENPLSGDAHRLINDGICFASRQIRKYSKRVSESFEDTTTFHQTNITGSRPPGIHSSSHLVCPLTLSPYPAVTNRVSTLVVRLRHASECLQRGEIRLDVVDKKSTTTERKSYSPLPPPPLLI